MRRQRYLQNMKSDRSTSFSPSARFSSLMWFSWLTLLADNNRADERYLIARAVGFDARRLPLYSRRHYMCAVYHLTRRLANASPGDLLSLGFESSGGDSTRSVETGSESRGGDWWKYSVLEERQEVSERDEWLFRGSCLFFPSLLRSSQEKKALEIRTWTKNTWTGSHQILLNPLRGLNIKSFLSSY